MHVNLGLGTLAKQFVTGAIVTIAKRVLSSFAVRGIVLIFLAGATIVLITILSI